MHDLNSWVNFVCCYSAALSLHCLADEQETPSIALASVVQHVPLELMDGILRNLTNDDSITDVQIMTAIDR